MSVLLGTEATVGLSAGVLDLTFCQIPAGTYEVGAGGQEDNPVRQVAIDSFELAETLTTNRQLAAALGALGDQRTVLMFESERDRRYSVVARGTKEEVTGIQMPRLREILAAMPSLASSSAQSVGDFSLKGALQAFDLLSQSPRIIPVTLEAHLLKNFDGPNQPALVSPFEASALAALFGLVLPTGEMWEAAAGDLRGNKYRNTKELRRVAHFHPADATVDVKTKEPNNFGLYDMLGNLWEAMANRYKEGSENREFRGGCWGNLAAGVRSSLRYDYLPGRWLYVRGFRLSRPQDSQT